MLFLMPNQQRQSKEGNHMMLHISWKFYYINLGYMTFITIVYEIIITSATVTINYRTNCTSTGFQQV